LNVSSQIRGVKYLCTVSLHEAKFTMAILALPILCKPSTFLVVEKIIHTFAKKTSNKFSFNM